MNASCINGAEQLVVVNRFPSNTIFVLLMMAFYGPMFGFIEFGLAVSIYGFYVYALNRGSLHVYLSKIVYPLFFLIIWTLFINLINENQEIGNYYYFIKTVRAVGIFLLFYYLARCHRLFFVDFAGVMIKVLFIHVVVCYLQQFGGVFIPGLKFGGVFIPGLRELALSLNTFNVNDVDNDYDLLVGIRVRGLMTGYDSAGIMCAICALMVRYERNKLLGYLIFLFSVGALVFTSRTGMLLFLVGYFLLLSMEYRICVRRMIIYVLFLVLFAFFIMNSSHLFLAKTKELVQVIVYLEEGYSDSFADAVDNHYSQEIPVRAYFPGVPSRSHYSMGMLDSDIGYIQILFNYGLHGSLIVISIALCPILKFIRLQFQSGTLTEVGRFGVVMSVIILVSSFKGPYFFSRGIFDAYLLVAFLPFVDSRSVAFCDYDQDAHIEKT